MATSETETDKLFHRDFKHVINYLEAQKQLMDAHMVDFFTSNHWETLLPRNIREDLESLPQQQFTSLPNACTESKDFERFGESLKKFLKEARKAQLRSFPWVKDQKEFTSENRVDFISHIMTPKKSYEVDVMSDVINRLVKQFQVSKILDLGSGKGYLSQHLALQYGLNVLGVDSSDSNTQNAAKRNERLVKAWKGLAKKSQREKVDASSNLAEGNVTSDHLDSQPLGRLLDEGNKKNGNSESLPNCCYHITCRISHVCSHDDNNLEVSGLNKADKASHLYNPMQSTVEAESKQPLVSKVDCAESKHSAGGTHQSQFVTEVSSQETFPQSSVPSLNCKHRDGATHCDMQCRNIHVISSKITDSKHAASTMNSKSQQPQTASPTSFVPVTGFVDQSFVANGGLTRLFDKLGTTNGVTTGCNGIFVVGLHTCGDLAPVALRIFVTEASVRVICIVGCCYHLVSQEVGGSDDTSDNPGFPMSQFLKPFRLHISRNATMVAQQAADRIAMESKCPPSSVLYRAILQVILREKFDLDGRGMHVGKAGAKCKDFKEYVHKCLKKLGLEDRISEFSDGEVESYLKRFINQEKQLHAFHQLRAAIAPCIESVFLLDRLCYLYEQGYTSACIVRLFDPVKSPRCYAIIAHKT